MIRLHVVVEGQTEEAFVKEVLAKHLSGHGVWATATIVGKAIAQRRRRDWSEGRRLDPQRQGLERPGQIERALERGGGHFRHWRRDIQRLLGKDQRSDVRVTTLFDLYGLPGDFPGLDEHAGDVDTHRRCDALQRALFEDLGDWRLIPYLQRHEFEALVLAWLPSLGELLDAEDDLAGLAMLEAEIDGLHPEDIDDGRETAPSKRLINHIPSYRKTLHGPLAISETGLSKLRSACPRFDAWIGRLEALSVVTTPE